ncbi:hypothetical protein Taro_015314, partial [Colocasia esculenta]|nr:hypothetical protein [Colocasia esculenta]
LAGCVTRRGCEQHGRRDREARQRGKPARLGEWPGRGASAWPAGVHPAWPGGGWHMDSNPFVFRCSSGEAVAHKRRKTRESKMAAERDKIARLQRELDEARSSLDQQAKEAAEAPEEEVTFAGGDGKLRQSVSSKAKEVERLKRKKSHCLCFAV